MRRWDGASWSTVGAPNFITGTFLGFAVDSSSTPYVATGDVSLGYKGSVLRYTGSTASGWEPVGQQGLSFGRAYWSHLAFDANGVLYYAYQDDGAGLRVSGVASRLCISVPHHAYRNVASLGWPCSTSLVSVPPTPNTLCLVGWLRTHRYS